MELRDKVIFVDCDGVLVDWSYSFNKWMESHGYKLIVHDVYDLNIAYGIDKAKSKELVKQFNESAAIGWLTPFRDAIKYVKKLHEEHGYVFRCVTSLSTNPYSAQLRQFNLEMLFGHTVFEDILCLDTGADKTEALKAYAGHGCFWIEDKPENAIVGSELGYTSILIEHDHNADFFHADIPVVSTWKEIYEMIV